MIGVDAPIERLRLLFVGNLWSGKNNSFNGRCFRNEQDGKLIPEIKITGNDYEEVLLQDFNDSTVFFDVEPTRESNGKDNLKANINIYFAVDLSKLYPSLDRNEATETAYRDVIDQINIGGFNFTSLSTGFESYDTWNYDESAEDNMSSYHLFRINTTIDYNLNCI